MSFTNNFIIQYCFNPKKKSKTRIIDKSIIGESNSQGSCRRETRLNRIWKLSNAIIAESISEELQKRESFLEGCKRKYDFCKISITYTQNCTQKLKGDENQLSHVTYWLSLGVRYGSIFLDYGILFCIEKSMAGWRTELETYINLHKVDRKGKFQWICSLHDTTNIGSEESKRWVCIQNPRTLYEL